ncbi:MAG: Fic family protein [Halanaerobiales bacterium]|nr:Fic family protein [Halanaerobiales bacterium]
MKPFSPYKLPLKEKIDPLYFYDDLIQASTNIGKYQIMLEKTKIDAEILMNPLLLNEAVQSTKIEGTQVTLDEVLESEVEEKEKNNDVKEVLNYHKAIKYGKRLLTQIPISTRMFKELHKILLSDGVRGANRAPGEFRMIQNFIGPKGCTIETASFVPSPPQRVDEYMSNLDNYINEPTDSLYPLVRIAIIHAQFETIHPFLDGNGRIGRILIPLYLFDQKVSDSPNLFISETLEKDKHKYYRLLNETRSKENWNQWIKFFLESINKQMDKSFNLIKNIDSLYERDLKLAMDVVSNNNIVKIMNVMFGSPIFTINKMSELTGIPYGTCRRYISQLEDKNLLYSDDRSRGRKYYYYNLLDLFR